MPTKSGDGHDDDDTEYRGRGNRATTGPGSAGRLAGAGHERKAPPQVRTRRRGRPAAGAGQAVAAAEAYDEAARELFGEHARLNFPDGVEVFSEAEAAKVEDQAEIAEATPSPRVAA